MDVRTVGLLGFRLLAVFFGAVAVIQLGDLPDRFDPRIGSLDQVRYVTTLLIAVAVTGGGAFVLWSRASRLTEAVIGRVLASEPAALGALASGLLGAYFIVPGLANLASLAQAFDRARDILTIVTASAIPVAAGVLLWRSNGRFAASPASDGGDDHVSAVGAAALGVSLIGIVFTVRVVTVLGVALVGDSPLDGFQVLVRLVVGIGLIAGARAIAERIARDGSPALGDAPPQA